MSAGFFNEEIITNDFGLSQCHDYPHMHMGTILSDGFDSLDFWDHPHVCEDYQLLYKLIANSLGSPSRM